MHGKTECQLIVVDTALDTAGIEVRDRLSACGDQGQVHAHAIYVTANVPCMTQRLR